MSREGTNLGPWVRADNVIAEKDGTIVCQLNTECANWARNGQWIAAVPNLTNALVAALHALHETIEHIPPHSSADLVAARAVTMAFEALSLAGEAQQRETQEGDPC